MTSKPLSLFTGLLLLGILLQNPVPAQAQQVSKQKALVLLDTESIVEMRAVKKILESHGIRIRLVLPPDAFIIEADDRAEALLSQRPYIKLLATEKINGAQQSLTKLSHQRHARVWNTMTDLWTSPPPRPAVIPPLQDKVRTVEDIIKTKEQALALQKAYADGLPQKRLNWRQEQESLLAQSPFVDTILSELSAITARAPAEGESEISYLLETSDLASTYGAGYYDTSLYMIGDIAATIYFIQDTGSPNGGWNQDSVADFLAVTFVAIDQFIDDQPLAHLSFTLVPYIDENGEPLPCEEDQYNFDIPNDLREQYDTHWAFYINAHNGGDLALAYLWGPNIDIASQDYEDGYLIRHEIMHIFGAQDQYPQALVPWSHTTGYLRVVNANSAYDDGTGYFDGAGEGQDDIMMTSQEGHIIGAYTAGQVGWRDADGDGILDVLETVPKTESISLLYTDPNTVLQGSMHEQAIPNDAIPDQYNVIPRGSVSLNTITTPQCRLEDGPWVEGSIIAGSGSGDIDFQWFHPGMLPNGTYTVTCRGINSAGNPDVLGKKLSFDITESPSDNTYPFAVFDVSPDTKGSTSTAFSLDAGRSQDFEDAAEQLLIRWDFNNDGAWDTGYSQEKSITHVFPAAGEYSVVLEVQDLDGAVNSYHKLITVASEPLPPALSWTATPEKAFGTGSIEVIFDPGASFDYNNGSDELLIRWDLDDNGVWDTDLMPLDPLSHTFSIDAEVNPSKRWRVRAELTDTQGQTAEGIRDFWAVTYDQAPNPVELIDYDTTGIGSIHSASSYSSEEDFLCLDNGHIYTLTSGDDTYLKTYDRQDLNSHPPVQILDSTKEANGFTVKNGLAYVISENHLDIFDIQDPSTPIHLSERQITDGYLEDLSSIFVQDGLAFIGNRQGRFTIVDIQDPSAPQQLSQITLQDWIRDITVQDQYAYLAQGYAGLTIVDISSPEAPELISQVRDAETGKPLIEILVEYRYATSQNVVVQDGYAFLAEHKYLTMIDIHDPYHPVLARTFQFDGYRADTPYPYEIKRLYIEDSSAYVISGTSVAVIDIQDPLNPQMIDYYRHPSTTREINGDEGEIYLLSDDDLSLLGQTEKVFLKVSASDPDEAPATLNDKLLYQWDLHSDGSFEERTGENYFKTAFSNPEETNMTVHVRDRFHAEQTLDITPRDFHRPKIVSRPIITADPLALYSYVPEVHEPDNDPVTFSLRAGPEGMIIDSSTGELSWLPPLEGTGRHPVSIVADDNRDGSTVQSFEITVESDNHPPQITAGPTATPETIEEGETAEVTVTAMDEDGDILIYNWQASAGTVIGSGSSVTYQSEDVRRDTAVTITVDISDPEGASVSGSTEITVLNKRTNKKR